MRTTEYLDRNVSTLKLLVRIGMCIISLQLTAWVMGVLPIRNLTFPWAANPAAQQDVTLWMFFVIGLITLGGTICVLQEIASMVFGSRRDLSPYVYG